MSTQYNAVTLAILKNARAESTRVRNCIEGTERDPVNPAFSQSIVDTLGALVTADDIAGMNQKASVYTVRAARWIASQGLDTGKHSRILSFVVATVCDSTDARIEYSNLHYLAGKRDGTGTTSIGGISRAKMGAIVGFGSSNMGTLSAQISGFSGKNGILTGLGVVSKSDVHGFNVTAKGRSHPFVIAYALTLNGLSDRTVIESMREGD